MSSYTMQLRAYIEHFSQHKRGLSIRERIEIGRPKLFDFYYPIFSQNYKKRFEENFIRKFYMREIGFETEELFKFNLETWLNINMPYFNKLFESECIKYDPLINAFMTIERDTDLKRDRKDDRNIHQKSETDGTTKSDIEQDSNTQSETLEDDFNRRVESDNPDTRLRLQTQQGKGVIEYASDIQENKADNKTNTSGKANTKTDSTDVAHTESVADQSDNLMSNLEEFENFIERREGKVGTESQAKMIMDYRNALLRVEVQIHKEMNELFMLVY